MKHPLVLAVLYACVHAYPARATGNETAALILSNSTVSRLQVALFLEHAQNAYLHDIMASDTDPSGTLKTVLDEDNVHRQALHNIIAATGAQPVSACKFTFSNPSPVRIGQTISAVRVGAALDLLVNLPAEDAILASGLATMAAAEARHQTALNKGVWKDMKLSPIDAPMPASWAFNIVRHFAIPNTCSVLPPVSVLPPLQGHVTLEGVSSMLKVNWKASDLANSGISVEPLFFSWLGRPGGPVHTPMRLSNETSGEWGVPEGIAGTAFVALTTQAQFTTYEELGRQVVAGPVAVTIRQGGNGTIGH